MGSTTIAIRCANCDRELQQHERPCPSWEVKTGSIVSSCGTITPLGSLRGEQRDETGFKKVEFNSRSKISREKKLRAEEYLLIDRSSPKMTKKYHHVEEANDDGQRVTVHEHEETFPAKRRPLKYHSRNGG